MIKKLAFLLCLALALGLAGSNPVSGAALDLRVATGNDDAEEHLNAGMDLTSSDLEIPYEDAGAPPTDEQLIGMRWSVPLAKGAALTKAYLELQLKEVKGSGTNDAPVNVIIEGQLDPNPPAFGSAAKNITNRPRTKAQVKWTLPPGLAVEAKLQSPDVLPIINELLSQDGWASGNAMVFIIRDDKDSASTGLRTVYTNNGAAAKAPLLHLEVFIPEATKPDPANGAAGVTMAVLQWTTGEGAVAHNVYVGLKPELTEAELVGPKQPVAMFFYAPGLQPGVTYYWRVDEIDAAGKVTAGTVWSFTALPLTAWAPQPADAAKNLFPSQTLSWSAGQMAAGHQVYFSSNPFDVSLGAAAADKGKTAETKLATGSLALKTTYYWRVDEIQADGKALKGPVWSFKTADALELPIASGTDDAEEHLNAGMDLTSSDLEIPYEDAGTPPTDEQLIGMRWSVPLAKDAAVTKASIEFVLKEVKGSGTNTAPANVIIEGQLAPNPPTFTSAAKDIGSRTRTKAQVKWTLPPGLAVEDKFQTPDLSPIIKELLSQDGWASGNAIVFVVRDDKDNPSTGLRTVYTNNGGATKAPLLRIEVATDPAPAAAAVDIRVASGTDDAEEHLVDNPRIDITSSDLEMPNEDWSSATSKSTDPQLIGMRWQVPLTKDMVVTKAYIEFILSETKGSTAPVNLVIEGQLDPNPLGFTTTAKDISSRPPTKAQVKWTVPTGLKVDDKFQTPDLSPIIKELLSQDGWAIGNAVVFMVRDDKDNPSTGLRNAESFNTSSGTKAPLLHVEVQLP